MKIHEINERYGNYIWGVARRYHTGIWSAEDVFQHIISLLYEMPEADRDKLLNNESRTHSFIITRAINLVRRENIRQGTDVKRLEYKNQASGRTPKYHEGSDRAESIKMNDDNIEIDLTSGVSLESNELEIEFIREILFERLPEEMASFIYELAFPSSTTTEIAMEEQEKAKLDPNLRMNVKKLVILPKHVGLYIKLGGGRPPSKATISRWRKKIAELICSDVGCYVRIG